MLRRRVVVLTATVLALVLAGPGLAPAAVASTDTTAEAAFLQALNGRRAQAGLPALVVAADLVDVARRHSVTMADASDLHHNGALPGQVVGWQKVGENVGRGPSVDAVHAAFVASPSHDANLVEPAYLHVGIGVEERDGRLWVAQVFRQPTAPTEGTTSTRVDRATVMLARTETLDGQDLATVLGDAW